MAKRILKDPQLTLMANRKFNSTIDQNCDVKFMLAGAEIS